jgi:hypothetical protein
MHKEKEKSKPNSAGKEKEKKKKKRLTHPSIICSVPFSAKGIYIKQLRS